MSRVRKLGRGLGLAAKVGAGISIPAAGIFYLQTRNCHFETFNAKTDDYFFTHQLFSHTNPWKKPYSADSCVREVPFESLDQTLLDDAANGGTKLIERFTQGLWGGMGNSNVTHNLYYTYLFSLQVMRSRGGP